MQLSEKLPKVDKYPSYLNLYKSGELRKRVTEAYKILADCILCPRVCKVDRVHGEQGFCRAGHLPTVSSYNPHHGEEPPLSGSRGSGTIFFTYCTMKCIYCQNYPISQLDEGRDVSLEELARMMQTPQRRGCHNINFVPPSHFVPQILAALEIAIEGGLNIPLVYNTGGYDLLKTLKLMDGVVDIYLPDARYSDPKTAFKYSSAHNYPAINRAALKEMHRQVGDLVMDENGIAKRGLIIRHLVLPQSLAATRETLHFIATEISPKTYISLMDQYFPAYQACENPPLDRRITAAEYKEAIRIMEEEGLERGWKQLHIGLWEF